MNENDDKKIHKCEFCKYKTNRKYDLNKHRTRIHKFEINETLAINPKSLYL